MSHYNNYYKTKQEEQVPTEQLLQLLRIVWDGDLMSKTDRNTLVNMGFVARSHGFQIITGKGIAYLVSKGLIKA